MNDFYILYLTNLITKTVTNSPAFCLKSFCFFGIEFISILHLLKNVYPSKNPLKKYENVNKFKKEVNCII